MKYKSILFLIGLLIFGVICTNFLKIKKFGKPPEHIYSPDGIKYSELDIASEEYKTTYTQVYIASDPLPESILETCHSPVPKEDRVANHTGIQCVYASTEMLGRWAEEPKLTNPPLTSRSDCKSYSSPSTLAQRLNKLNVKYIQTTSKTTGRMYLNKYVREEGRGALIGIPGHALVCIHYDPEDDEIRIVDNSDSSLSIQKWTTNEFERRWEGWVCVIIADNDIIPFKTGHAARMIKIKDRNNENKEFPKDFVPLPTRG